MTVLQIPDLDQYLPHDALAWFANAWGREYTFQAPESDGADWIATHRGSGRTVRASQPQELRNRLRADWQRHSPVRALVKPKTDGAVQYGASGWASSA